MPAPAELKPPKSLLVIKPSSLGDIVHGLQVVESVARSFPECRIDWVARDRFAGLVAAAPFVSEVIEYRRKEGLAGLLDVMKQLRGRRYEVVWDMQGLLRSGLMAAAARAPVKWGRHDGREGSWLFSRRVAMAAGSGGQHAIPVLREFARTLGIAGEIRFPLALRPAEVFAWQGFFDQSRGPCLVIFTDSRGAGKEWPKFSRLTELIFAAIPECRVAWCAGERCAPDFAPPEGRFLNLTGCGFAEMLALARQPSVFVGNDSGPMHLSAAVGNRVLAIFGPTSPERFGPWPPESPRTASIRAPQGNLAELSAEAVLEALLALIAGGGAG
jgi:heptosyltransferase I